MSDFWDVFTDLCEQIRNGYDDSRKGSKSPLFYPSIHPVLKEA